MADITPSEIKQRKELFLQALELAYGNITTAAKSIGVTRQQIIGWKRTDDIFAALCKEIEEGLIDFAESKLFELINGKNLGAVCFFLKCKGKARGWIEKFETQEAPMGSLEDRLTRALKKSREPEMKIFTEPPTREDAAA